MPAGPSTFPTVCLPPVAICRKRGCSMPTATVFSPGTATASRFCGGPRTRVASFTLPTCTSHADRGARCPKVTSRSASIAHSTKSSMAARSTGPARTARGSRRKCVSPTRRCTTPAGRIPVEVWHDDALAGGIYGAGYRQGVFWRIHVQRGIQWFEGSNTGALPDSRGGRLCVARLPGRVSTPGNTGRHYDAEGGIRGDPRISLSPRRKVRRLALRTCGYRRFPCLTENARIALDGPFSAQFGSLTHRSSKEIG